MDSATEKGYIEAVSKGDEQAFEALFLHYFPRIKGFISGILQNGEEAEDISQDIFVSMWQNRERLTGIDNLNAYLFRIAKNTAISNVVCYLKTIRNSRPSVPYYSLLIMTALKKKYMQRSWNTSFLLLLKKCRLNENGFTK